jgi:hypothetical protein
MSATRWRTARKPAVTPASPIDEPATSDSCSYWPCQFIQAPWAESKEAVIFEQIGQLAGVTAYLHVHIELSITSVEQQLSKYRQLLVTKLGTKESIQTFMLGQ